MGKAFQVGKQWGKGTKEVGSWFVCRVYSLWEWEGVQPWGAGGHIWSLRSWVASLSLNFLTHGLDLCYLKGRQFGSSEKETL